MPVHVRLPYQQGALISMFHEAGQVERIVHERGGVVMWGRVPGRMVAQFIPWSINDAQALNAPSIMQGEPLDELIDDEEDI